MPKPRRVRSVTLVAVLIGALGIANIWRFFALMGQRALILQFGARFDPAYVMGAAVIWGIVFLALAVMTWRGASGIGRLVPIALALYSVYTIALPTRALPTLIWHGALLLFAFWALNRRKSGEET